jgi:hypothetical protein
VTAGLTTLFDMQYDFSTTQNNGKIVSVVDGVNHETLGYTYDTLNRLPNSEGDHLRSRQLFQSRTFRVISAV